MFQQLMTFNNDFSNITHVLIFSFIYGVIIALTYSYCSIGFTVSYFWKSLILLTMITAAIMFTIGSNLVLSLGLVGALSIIRFRAAVREMEDALFIFFSIAVGLTCGSQAYFVGGMIIAFCCPVWIILKHINLSNINGSHILVLHVNSKKVNWETIEDLLRKFLKKHVLKSIQFTSGQDANERSERIYKIIPNRKDDLEKLIEQLSKANGIFMANIYSPNSNFNV